MLHRHVSGPAVAGLSTDEVASRVERTNRVPHTTSRILWQIFRANVLTLFNAVVGASFAVLLLLGNWPDALFGLGAAGNAVIRVLQQIASKDVVRDDVLVLRAGNQVTADASVIEGVGPRG